MDIHRLDRIFKPQRVALCGVTANPNSVGGTVLRNLVGAGFPGVVYPVNRDYEAVLGVPCYADLRDLPRTPDLAVICAPAAEVPDWVRRCGEAEIRGLVIVSAGFAEAGDEGRALEAAVDVERRRFDGMLVILLETLMRVSYLVADLPAVRELDINPLLATPRGVLALDARVIVDRAELGRDDACLGGRPYAHLALRPYPEELARKVALPDGTTLLLRPIRPEDEPLWMEMLASCTRETIYSRFRYMFVWSEHRVATRYCFIDYDREIAMVAETEKSGRRRLVGVGRLVADPDHETVEYAVLVTDAWQNRGLGGVLTDVCLDVARQWGLRRVVAETTTDNERMIAVFRRRGFSIEIDPDGALVRCVREMVQPADAEPNARSTRSCDGNPHPAA